jgi:hypothetical protein
LAPSTGAIGSGRSTARAGPGLLLKSRLAISKIITESLTWLWNNF